MVRVCQPGYSDIQTEYDWNTRTTSTSFSFAGQTKTASYTQGSDGREGISTLISGNQYSTAYDTIGRIDYTYITMPSLNGLRKQINYLGVAGSRTTNIPSSVVYSSGGSNVLQSSYMYDDNGNITSMTVDGVIYTYTYDSLNQLKTVSTSNNSYNAIFYYDNGGNITSKTVNGTTTNYGYGDTNWKDKLTSYNGQNITYDNLGNPLSYRGMTMSWTGRQLNSITNNGTTSNYLYNADGIRTRKTVGSVTTDYFLDGSTILAEKTGNNVIWYIYDSDGEILGFTYNGTPYYYLKNQQGDVIKVVDASMNVVASYTYDAWGKVLSSTGSMANTNPIRYRSYYYDTETGFYYLQSRYYDPETGRFLNADGQLGYSGHITAYNLFCYCNNNPIRYIDTTGNVAGVDDALILIGVVVFLTVTAIGVETGLGMSAIDSINGNNALSLDWDLQFPNNLIEFPTPPPKNDQKSPSPSILPVPNPHESEKKSARRYYHVTTHECAPLIWAAEELVGSSYEGGYVFAWLKKPSKKAIKLSGAHSGVILSFKTNAAFQDDWGITDPYVKQFYPVRTVFRGPISIWDVEVVR